MFSGIVDVLEIIEEDDLSDQKVEARSIMRSILSFEFVFTLHDEKYFRDHKWVVNSITKKKKKNQDIVNAMDLVKVSKQRLQVMRDDGWASLLAKISLFCTSHDIPILDMEAIL